MVFTNRHIQATLSALAQMNRVQWEDLHKHLKTFHQDEPKPGREDIPKKQLVEALLLPDQTKSVEAVKKLFRSLHGKKRKLYQLCEFLFFKIAESTLFGRTIYQFDDNSQTLIRIKQILLFLRVTRSKTHTKELQLYLPRVIEEAKHYELYPELLDALELWLEYEGGKSADSYEQILQDIRYYSFLHQISKELYFQHQSMAFFQEEIKFKKDKSSLKAKIIQILHLYKDNPLIKDSGLCQYYLLLFQFYHEQLEGKYEKSAEIGTQLLCLIEAKPYLFGNGRKAGIYVQMADNDLFRGRFDGAVYWIKAVQKAAVKLKILSHAVEQEIIFYAHFYQKDFEQAVKITIELINDQDLQKYPIFHQRFCYLHANASMQIGHWEEAAKFLDKIQKIPKDAMEWKVSMSVLKLQILTEKRDAKEYKIELDSLYKMIHSYRKRGFEYKYYYRIWRVLNNLYEMDFDFQQFSKNPINKKRLEEIKSTYKWEARSPEMIPFHEWLESKLLDL